MAKSKTRFKGNSPKQKNIYIVEMINEYIDGEEFPLDIEKWDDMEEFSMEDFLGCSIEHYEETADYDVDVETKYVGTFSSYNKAESFLTEFCELPIHKVDNGYCVAMTEPMFNILDEEDSSREIIHFVIRKTKMDEIDLAFVASMADDFGFDDEDTEFEVTSVPINPEIIEKHSNIFSSIADVYNEKVTDADLERQNIRVKTKDNDDWGN